MPVVLNVNQVSLIEHHQPHRRLRTIHGRVGRNPWQHTHEQALEYIQGGLFSYYLLHNGRAVRLVIGQTSDGEKFLKAELDGDIPTLLLQLASTPASKIQPPS